MERPGYLDKEQNEKAKRVAELFDQLEYTSTYNDKERADLIGEAYTISFSLVRYLRREYPNSFRSFIEFVDLEEGDRMPFSSYTGGNDLGSTEGITAKKTKMFKKYVDAYGLKQDDILIFTDTKFKGRPRRQDVVLYMYDNNHASTADVWRNILPKHLEETLKSLGLDRETAERLWFPDNSYPLFTYKLQQTHKVE